MHVILAVGHEMFEWRMLNKKTVLLIGAQTACRLPGDFSTPLIPISILNLAEATTIPLPIWFFRRVGCDIIVELRDTTRTWWINQSINLSLSLSLCSGWWLSGSDARKLQGWQLTVAKGSWQQSRKERIDQAAAWFDLASRRHIIICNWWQCHGLTTI